MNSEKMVKNKPLWQDIKRFSKHKYLLFIIFLFLAVLGFLIPIIPGIILLILAIALVRKGWMSKIRRHIRLWKSK